MEKPLFSGLGDVAGCDAGHKQHHHEYGTISLKADALKHICVPIPWYTFANSS